jgi:16S rRNA (uracil1498-N3)-methyltransferase
VLRVPEVDEPRKLASVIDDWDKRCTLIYCDEGAPLASPIEALGSVAQGPLAVLIGPEGGFAEEERAMILRQPFARAISLGPRIMRADTAAVAALALVNAVLGDWR